MIVATHPGDFHADDVFAVAALQLVHGPLDVIRTRDPSAWAAADLRVDIGGRDDAASGDFDHHQRGGAGQLAAITGVPDAVFAHKCFYASAASRDGILALANLALVD